jgi:CheY-like chemotaxis protein
VEQDARKTFLIVEDNADDAILIRRAFTRGTQCDALVCRNVSEARAYLLGAGMYSDRKMFPFPQAVVSDLRLGEDSGLTFLAWVRKSENFPDLPFILLSGAASQREMDSAAGLGASRVLRKPSDLSELQTILTQLVSDLTSPFGAGGSGGGTEGGGGSGAKLGEQSVVDAAKPAVAENGDDIARAGFLQEEAKNFLNGGEIGGGPSIRP